MSDFLKNLALDSWYKVCIYLGTILILVSLLAEARWLTNEQVGLAGLFLLFLGLGEWKNEKVFVEFKPANIYTGPAALMQTPIRKPDLFGMILLGVSGLFLFLLIKSFF